jgi:hypothetical protein
MAPVAASPTPVAAPLPTIPPPIPAKDKKAAARKRFEDVYAVVRDDLLADFRKHNMPEESIDYYRRVRPFPRIYFSLSYTVIAEHGLQRSWRKTQPWLERRRLGRYPQGP